MCAKSVQVCANYVPKRTVLKAAKKNRVYYELITAAKLNVKGL
jgi:hypothetical protein